MKDLKKRNYIFIFSGLLTSLISSHILQIYLLNLNELSYIEAPIVFTIYMSILLIGGLIGLAIYSTGKKHRSLYPMAISATIFMLMIFHHFMVIYLIPSSVYSVFLLALKRHSIYIVIIFLILVAILLILLIILKNKMIQTIVYYLAVLLSFSTFSTDFVLFFQNFWSEWSLPHLAKTKYLTSSSFNNGPTDKIITNIKKPPLIIHILLDALSYDAYTNENSISVNDRFHLEAKGGDLFTSAYSNAHFTNVSIDQVMSGQFKRQKNSPYFFETLYNKGFDIRLYLATAPLTCKKYQKFRCYDRKWSYNEIIYKNNKVGYIFDQLKQCFFYYRQRINWTSPLESGPLDNIKQIRKGKFKANTNLILFEKMKHTIIAENNTKPSYHFLHLLLPHQPYVHQRDCKISNEFNIQQPGFSNPNSIFYQNQVACSNFLIKELLTYLKSNKLYDQAMIIIHGDHGPRGMFKKLPFLDSPITPQENKKLEQIGNVFLWIKLPYDTIRKEHNKQVMLLDIAPTLSTILNTSFNNGLGKNIFDKNLPLKRIIPIRYENNPTVLIKKVDGTWSYDPVWISK